MEIMNSSIECVRKSEDVQSELVARYVGSPCQDSRYSLCDMKVQPVLGTNYMPNRILAVVSASGVYS